MKKRKHPEIYLWLCGGVNVGSAHSSKVTVRNIYESSYHSGLSAVRLYRRLQCSS